MTQHSIYADYESKSSEYFSGVRWDIVRAIPNCPQPRILEIGCGCGDTGAAVISEGKCSFYCGLELNKDAAELARKQLDEVLVGNVETIEFPWELNSFDVLIISEVLEHLIDPWAALRRLIALMKPNALVFASSPNISHYRVVSMIVSGHWRLADKGVMDRTHLRWFTPSAYRELFEDCGFAVESISPVTPFGWRTRIINVVTFGALRHLFMVQIFIRAKVR